MHKLQFVKFGNDHFSIFNDDNIHLGIRQDFKQIRIYTILMYYRSVIDMMSNHIQDIIYSVKQPLITIANK